jgi:hypothetical protein
MALDCVRAGETKRDAIEMDEFQLAYRLARQRFGDGWVLLSSDKQAEAVTKELRIVQEERLTQLPDNGNEPG